MRYHIGRSSPFWMGYVLAAALGLGGCVGSLDLPDVEPTSGLAEDWSRPLTESDATITSLLSMVDDPQVESLVSAALSGNPDLAQTGWRLAESEALLDPVRVRRWPSVEGAVDGSRSREGSTSNASTQSTLSLQLSLQWEVDVWGRLVDQVSEAERRHGALEADYRAARNSLVARTLQAALDRIFLAQQLEVEQRRSESLQSTLDVVKNRYRLGLGNATDWDAAQTQLATVRADVAALRGSVRRTDHDLSVLLGDLSLAALDVPLEVPEVVLPLLPLPSETLARRPDVAAAMALLQAEGLAVDVARKALLPQFNLTGQLSQSGASLDDALSSDPVGALLGSLATPLLHRKGLRAEHEAAQYRRQEAVHAYRAVLLEAVRDVEDALATDQALFQQLPELDTARRFADSSYRSFEAQYARGLADLLDVLSAQRTAFDAESRWLEVRGDLLHNRIELGLALGLESL